METYVVNLFGAPGSGKSVTKADLFAMLKKMDVDCEEVVEFARELMYSGGSYILNDQLIVAGEQHRRVFMLDGKTKFILTDSPLLLSSVYNQYNKRVHGKEFDELLLSIHNRQNNINFFLPLPERYEVQGGRQQKNKSDAQKIGDDIEAMLCKNGIGYVTLGNLKTRAEDIISGLKSKGLLG